MAAPLLRRREKMTIYYNEDRGVITAFIGDEKGKTCLIRVRVNDRWAEFYILDKSNRDITVLLEWPEESTGTVRDRFRIALQGACNDPGVKKLGITRLLRAFA
jgi:hypothetical protein